MIVYLDSKAKFQDDLLSNRIEEKVHENFRRALGKSVSDSELLSWKNSLRHMGAVLADAEIPEDAGVAIEFNIPHTGKRIDFILTGTRQDGQRSAIIVELKQWQEVEATNMDAIVRTFVGGQKREVNHPSYQAWSYSMVMEDYNESVRTDPIHLNPCAYLHNCASDAVIRSPFYAAHTAAAPAFLKDDAKKLREFIKRHIKHGDQGETLYRIRDGKIRPSKGLADHLASLLKGNREFFLIDEQKLVYEKALELAKLSSAEKRHLLLVNGGPGTGKTVVAINLLVELTKRRLTAQYVTKNGAPRAVYESKLAGTLKKSRISNLFVGSGAFTETPPGTFDALIVDEAHRLNEKSGLFGNLGENQIKELIQAAGFTVFFLDEDQRIHWKDIGERENILRWAKSLGAEVTELTLSSQFRCNGSDGYPAWTDNVLQIRETANKDLSNTNYSFQVCKSAAELRDLIFKANEQANRARMVAGYCWDWASKKNPNAFDFQFPDFKAKWNLSEDGPRWIISPESVSEIGCIHTCQGLEVDYIGVIIGPDLVVRNGEIITDAGKRSSSDASIKGYKTLLKTAPNEAREKADLIIKNTYRTLMTRGMKGCYVFCTDPETNRYFQEMSAGAGSMPMATVPVSAQLESSEAKTIPFRILSEDEEPSDFNAVPIWDYKVTAGTLGEDQWQKKCRWAELPDHLAARKGFFLVQVVGESMNKKIPNGSWCLFREPAAGSRNGKIVLVQTRDHIDPNVAGRYTVKRYMSEKQTTTSGWAHSKIILSPESSSSSFSPIELTPESDSDFRILGEFVAVVV